MATKATISMFNGEVITVENNKSLINVIADEYKVNASDVQLEHLGEENYFGWIDVRDQYKTYTFWEEDVVDNDDIDVNPVIFSSMIYKTDAKEYIFKVKVILNLTNGRIALSDHCESEERYHPSRDRFTRYQIRSDTPWFNSLHECMATVHPDLPEEIMEMSYKLQQKMYMTYMIETDQFID